MSWRYYVRRAGSGLWLDTDAQLSEVELGWSLSASGFGTALLPKGLFAVNIPIFNRSKTVQKTNWFYNPSTNNASISQFAITNTNQTVTTTTQDGRRCIAVTKSVTGTGLGWQCDALTSRPAGTKVTVAMEVKVPSTNVGSSVFQFVNRDPGNADTAIGTVLAGQASSITIPKDDAWHRVYVTFNVKTARTLLRVGLQQAFSVTAGDKFYTRDVFVIDGDLEAFFDGDSANTPTDLYEWTGTEYASTSVHSTWTVNTTTQVGDPYYAEDGRPVWGKMDTLLFAEEDDELAWVGVCSAATPSQAGLQLEFTGPFGWMSRVPYSGVYSVWKTNAAEVVRHLVSHATSKPVPLSILPQGPDLLVSVGDEQPPDKPKEPPRRKGETRSEWMNSDRYNQYQDDLEEWNKKYGDREKFEIAYWDSPYVGSELEDLAKETGFEFREKARWLDKGNLDPALYFEFSDSLRRRRDDISFENGINIGKALDPKSGDEDFANHIIALGAGEGRKMRRVSTGDSDGRLYQGLYVQYKYIKNLTRLRAMAQLDLTKHVGKGPRLDAVTVRDTSGYASISTLRCGDEVEVISEQDYPTIDTWVRVTEITRRPTDSSSATIAVETI